MPPIGRTLFLVSVGLVFAQGVESAKKNVTIAKCCGLNETLTQDNRCLRSYNASWDLRIFFNGSLTHFKGRLPQKWILRGNVRPKCLKPVLENITKKNVIPYINGYMWSVEYDKQIAPNQYCLDHEYAIFCPDNLERDPQRITSVLVRKCCGQEAIYSETNSTCIQFKDSGYEIDVGQDKSLGAGFPDCPGGNRVVAGKLQEAQILGNGSLRIETGKVLLPSANYCLEHILEQAGGSASIISCQDYLSSTPLSQPTTDQNENLQFTIYPIGLAVSAIFLAATLAAGSLLPASHHVLHWRCQTNHVACLLVGDVLLCITQVAGTKMEYWPCFSIAVAMHFLFLAAFFWLNTMCFNIWWTFRDLRPQSTEKSQERLRLVLYEAYAWGVPFVIVFIGMVADLVPRGHDRDFLRPRFAENKCWFYGDTEILTYFFGPMGTLLFINLMLFILTARELTCGLWKRELVKSTTERAALGRVCLKLVVVMGVTWIADVVSWAVGGPQWLWYVTDVINCLQGVFIFVVVGCQPQVLSAVKRSWCLLRNRENGTVGTMNHHSSSSQGLPSVGDTLTNTNSIANTTKSVPLETNC